MLILKIFDDIIYSENLSSKDFYEKVPYIIDEIFYLSYYDKDELRNKYIEKPLLSIKSIHEYSSNYNAYKNKEYIEFLNNLFNSLQEIIIRGKL